MNMNNIRHFRKKDSYDCGLDMLSHQQAVPKSKLSSGSTADKHPVMLDDGKTVVYIKDKSREREIRLRYGLRKG